jgi:hypothetical protein
MEFAGPGTPLTADGLAAFTEATAAGSAEIWAVIAVETSGCGYLPDRRPQILFERHIFSMLTGHIYDDSHPDISQPTSGGWGSPGAYQYYRLAEALTLDEASALQSASWGLGQILGQNFRTAGFTSVTDMVDALVLSENNQLTAIASFLLANHLARPLVTHDWASFARGYNGPDYAAKNYDGQLAHFYSIYASGAVPDLTVRKVQMLLTYRNYNPGIIDGRMGNNTASAIRAFQTANGLPPTGIIDDDLIRALGG